MSRRKPIRKSRRRGVTLIFVVSLIAMFMLLGATFAVISANYLKSARQNAQREVYNDPPQITLERVLYTVLRGTTDRNTPAVFHDLGADIYGFQGFKATVTTPVTMGNSGNAFIGLRIDAGLPAGAKYPTVPGTDGFGRPKLNIGGGRFDNGNYDISQFAGAYNGQVLTFISGPARGISTRIVGYSYDPGTNAGSVNDDSILFIIMVDKGEASISNFFNPANQAQPNPALAGTDFLVNARPFMGKGAGELKPAYQGIAIDQIPPNDAAFVGAGNAFSALRVNRVGDTTSGLNSGYLRLGTNESYDIADYQNMFMAAVIQNTAAYNDIAVIPSFHRPELIDYARTQFNLNVQQLRPYFLGPIQGLDANMDFPALDLTAVAAVPQWQVDNDGDLINDSIWVDFGLPVQTDASGRRYKALGAVLCLDMDGRLNVNAHGTKYHLDGGYATDVQASPVPLFDSTANPVSTQQLQNRGPGYGPPEVSLRTALVDNAEYFSLLYGNASFPGRYGLDASPGIPGLDPLERDKLYGYPNWLFGNWYASYLDIQGRLAVGIDMNGGPRFDLPTIPDEYVDNPYELNLLSSGGGMVSLLGKDQPFSVAEAERFLRPNDIDSGILPDRLWRMSQRLWNESAAARNDTYRIRRSLTTDSYDLPVPSRDLLQELSIILSNNLDPALSGGTSPPPPQAVSSQVSGMLDRDLIMGLRMDINWAFGNGIDDNNNGVRDEAAIPPDPSNPGTPAPAGVNESVMNEPLWGGAANFDHDIDGTASGDPDAYLARMHFARKLFVLTLLMNPSIRMDLDDGSAEDDGNPSQIEARKIIAQWVANVVDFRDGDSIMTPFEFDLNPFDGWHLDGYIGTDETNSATPPPPFQGQPSRYVVWGSERPELLIFETLAAHDRRTEDTDADRRGNNGVGMGQGAQGKKTTDPNDPDDDFDQRFKPRGLFYLELVNPWSDSSPDLPAELYSTVNGKAGIDLRRLDYATGTSPIWRVLVVKDNGKGRDPDTPSTNANDIVAAGDKERSIYFTTAANIPADAHGQTYTPDNNVLNDMGIIGLQEYAVIGTAGLVNGGVYTMPIGMRRDANMTTDLKIPQTRRIELEPGANQCRIYQPNPANPAVLTTQVRPCVAVPVQDFTVSEPVAGYTAPAPFVYQDNGLLEFSYQPAVDEPFDRTRPDRNDFNQDGTVNNFREVHLQRLANPLVPFHAVTNPYRTIDSISVDLTVFNGMDETDLGQTEAQATNWVSEENIVFSSKERGEYEIDNNVPANRSRVIWEHEPNSPAAASGDPAIVGDQHYFSYNLGKNIPGLGKIETLGKVNFPFDIANPKFAGVAPVAIPWLAWNNRPYVSQLEMMMVPKGRTSRLLHDYSLTTGFQSYDYSNPANQNQTFRYLLNFFQSASGNNQGPDLHRLFEFTHVPSRFAGTETWLNPTFFQNNMQASGINGFNAPFNQISSYRYPGKINLNTINQVEVFMGLYGRAEGPTANLNDYFGGHPGPTWPQFVTSRAGYAGGQPGVRSAILASNSAYPTFFANPFRSPEDGNMVPELAGTPNLLVRPDSECSLLRSDDLAAGTNAARTPLFESKNLTEPFDDNNRNPYFRYESLQRLGNLTTTHSNVYAIWITVGYFEVDAAGRLGKELGSDVGKVKRHRLFSMVDRSIPFAYEPGQNHNIDRIILTKRFIE